MAIIDYVGAEGCCITVESAEDLHEAIDHLHTLVMDNISEDSPLLDILSETMDAIERVNSEAVEQPPTGNKSKPSDITATCEGSCLGIKNMCKNTR